MAITPQQQKIVSELAQQTGVSERDVDLILRKLHLDKSLSRLEGLVGESRLSTVTVNDIRVGVMFDRNMIHK